MKHTVTVLTPLVGEGHVVAVSTNPEDLRTYEGKRLIWIVGGSDEGEHHGIPGDRFVNRGLILVRIFADHKTEDMSLELEALCARVRDKITAAIALGKTSGGYQNLDPPVEILSQDIIGDPRNDIERDDSELTLALDVRMCP